MFAAAAAGAGYAVGESQPGGGDRPASWEQVPDQGPSATVWPREPSAAVAPRRGRSGFNDLLKFAVRTRSIEQHEPLQPEHGRAATTVTIPLVCLFSSVA